MMIGTFERCRSERHTSVPDSPGSIRSSSTRSAPLRSYSANASGPVAATATSYPSRRSMYDSASEKDSSSSTTSTRVTAPPWLRWSLSSLGALRAGSQHGQRAQCDAHSHSLPRQSLPLGRCLGPMNGRQPNGECRASTRNAPYRDGAAVVCCHVLHDCQAQPGAARGARPRLIHSVEALEYPGKLVLGNADALVAHRDVDVAVGRPRTDGHPSPPRAVGDGVVDEVGDGHGQLGF